mgnify:CR=1 FL=1
MQVIDKQAARVSKRADATASIIKKKPCGPIFLLNDGNVHRRLNTSISMIRNDKAMLTKHDISMLKKDEVKMLLKVILAHLKDAV